MIHRIRTFSSCLTSTLLRYIANVSKATPCPEIFQRLRLPHVADRVFKLSWQPRIQDYREAFLARTQASGARRKLTVVYLIAAVPFVFFLLAAGLSAKFLVFSIYLALGLLLVIVTGPAQYVFATRFWNRYPLIQARSSARVGDEEIQTRTGNQAESWSWAMVDGVIETENVFVIELTVDRQRTFLLLAKRGLASEQQLPALTEFLNAQHPG